MLWTGRAVSAVGDWVFDTTLVLWVATQIARGQAWAPLAVSGVLVSTSIPVFLIGPIAGVFADRWDKRRTMFTMDALRVALILLLIPTTGIMPLPFVPHGRTPALWHLGVIYVTVFLATTCAQFFNSSQSALIGDIVSEPDRPRAFAFMQSTLSLAIIIGPPLAAPLLFSVGVQWALAFNALSFAVSFVALLSIRAPLGAPGLEVAAEGNFLREFVDGLGFYRRSRVLTTLSISLVCAMLGFGALNALGVFFLTEDLHAPAKLYGFIGSFDGLGLLLGAGLAGLYSQRLGAERTVYLSLLAMGGLIVLLSRLTLLAPALLVGFLIGVPNAALNVAVGPILLKVTPRHYLGRVSAVLNPVTNLASVVSLAIAGFLTSVVFRGLHANFLGFTFGPVDTVFTLAGFMAIGGGTYASIRLRPISRQDDMEPM